ncbi:endonuclease MutS2 [Bombilactobacillus folatiphilus]|uniref:Endonuclease MutS2 n=1 Tax=Bombilactobacillus folatiphilus TaxID=2923362 RepID=A0ABY4P9Q6_9LACO|nr:endonuclease MutS2 [Bombilactobacillus folatiphilus]UQS82460.1 endonuclease MutS2 [Bombilactobacillus folatiphilus]
MNQRILQTLEYDKVRQSLTEFLITDPGLDQLKQLQPQTQIAQVKHLLAQTADAVELCRLAQELPIEPLQRIDNELKRLQIDALLNGSELYRISMVLRVTNNIKTAFEQLRLDGVDLQELYDYGAQLVALPNLNLTLQQSVDSQGKLLDTADPQLKRVRRSILQSQQQVHEQMDHYLQGKQNKYLSEKLITVRDGRLVLPVKQESRNHFGGVIHDQSASGQTVYVEPQTVIALNNKIQEQQAREKQIIHQILQKLSDTLRPYVQELAQNTQIIGQLDLIQAKAQYAARLQAVEPTVNANYVIDLKQARHPLIDPAKVVANTIILGKDYRNIIITGPNTGGKTITLKTTGLLQLMAQSGLFIPAQADSQVTVLTEIFADIGDEQSIEQNLSTFSSHMDNIIQMLPHLSESSLVLLDELGAGTDPKQGAALAMALIEAMSCSRCLMLVTTHYPELKLFAYDYPQTTNASMEFDEQTLQPTYRLLIGVPGSSNAFDIAQHLGMDAQIVQQARQIQSDDEQDLNKMIQDLERQRKEFEQKTTQYQTQLAQVQQQQEALAAQQQTLTQQQNQILQQAQTKANQLVAQAQERSEKIIADLHHLQQQAPDLIKEDQIISARTNLKKLHHDEVLKKNKVLQRQKRKQQLKIGDDVHVDEYGQDGVIVGQDKKGNFEVQLGIIKMKLASDQITKVKNQPEQQSHFTQKRSHSRVPLKLDLRGERYEEAMGDLEQYLDAALVAGYGQVTIVHGFGTGAIRKGVQKALRQNPRVKSFEYAPASSGGQGATIVKFG